MGAEGRSCWVMTRAAKSPVGGELLESGWEAPGGLEAGRSAPPGTPRKRLAWPTEACSDTREQLPPPQHFLQPLTGPILAAPSWTEPGSAPLGGMAGTTSAALPSDPHPAGNRRESVRGPAPCHSLGRQSSMSVSQVRPV